jgi:type VI secretion system protein ImpA
MLNLQILLSEAKESSPCGPNLEHDRAFFELEEAAKGKPEQSIGSVLNKGEDPDWPKVAELAQGLLVRSKDLRVAVHLTRACSRTDGVLGLAAGLELIHGLLERYWDGLHPLLEADQDGDPTERLNALTPLADAYTLIKDLRDAFLINSREHGQLQAREVEIAFGRLASSGSASVGPVKTLSQIHAQIEAAFASDRAVPSALREARERVLGIDALLVDRVGADRAIDLKPLAQCLETLLEACDAALGIPSVAAARDTPAPQAGTAVGGTRLSIEGQIATREDAVRVLDLVCNYLEKHEPSSPAPLFIRRAQRLITKNFIEIVKDLMPDSLSSLERLAGGELDKKK